MSSLPLLDGTVGNIKRRFRKRFISDFSKQISLNRYLYIFKPLSLFELNGVLSRIIQVIFSGASIYTYVGRVARFFLVQNTKTGKNTPNYHKLYQMSVKYNKRP
jgi:hypothetical protein